jgi:putative ABC transport system substrate-binding protein
VLPRAVFAQGGARARRLCWLSGAAPRSESYNVAFSEQLAKLGFVEGKNLTIEFASAEGRIERFPELAADLARRGCDAFLSPGSEASLVALKNATRDTPIVMVAIDYDPLERGHIAGLARPGGRITGVHQLQTALAEKRIEVLRELLPQAKRIGVLADGLTADTLKATQGAAKRLGFELVVHEFKRAPYDYEAAFADFGRAKLDAFLPLPSGFFVPARKKIPELALKYRLPGVFNNPLWVEAGGLLSYGTNLADMFRRAAEKMAKVLGGAKPADIPVEQPTLVEMVVNMKTAKALGVTIPQGIWFRAERIIE